MGTGLRAEAGYVGQVGAPIGPARDVSWWMLNSLLQRCALSEPRPTRLGAAGPPITSH